MNTHCGSASVFKRTYDDLWNVTPDFNICEKPVQESRNLLSYHKKAILPYDVEIRMYLYKAEKGETLLEMLLRNDKWENLGSSIYEAR